jgi:hypothetical protein
MARIFTSRINSSGRSSVVFMKARFPEIWFSVNRPPRKTLRRFHSAKNCFAAPSAGRRRVDLHCFALISAQARRPASVRRLPDYGVV